MHTPFNDNQNLPKTGNNPKVIPILQHLEQCLQENLSVTRSFQATLPQIVWLTAVNPTIINWPRCCYEYSGNLAVKSLILELFHGLYPYKCNFMDFLGSYSSKAPPNFKNGASLGQEPCQRKRSND